MAKKASDYLVATFLNKEVQIYPGDTHSKFGIVREITPDGVVFEVTRSFTNEWPVGSIRFVAFSARLTFSLIKK